MIDTLASPWLPYAVLVIVTAIARLRCGSWFAPAASVGLVWSFFAGASLVLVEYPVPGAGIWMLVVLIILLQAGALIAHELHPAELHPAEPPAPDNGDTLDWLIRPCRTYGLLCAAAAMAGCVLLFFLSLNQFDLPLEPFSILVVGAKWNFLRLDGALEPWSVRLLVMWFHPAGLLGGFLFACSHTRRDRAIGVATLLPALGDGVLTGARAPILLGLTCWIGGYVACHCVRNRGKLRLFSNRRVALFVLGAASMVGMFAWIDAVRDSVWTQDILFDVHGTKLVNYIFGSTAAFARWYAHSSAPPTQWGARTFAGAFDLLHIKGRTVGMYGEMSNVVGTEMTNIYTIFRGLMEDFTPFGAPLILIGIGGFAGRVYCIRSNDARKSLLYLSAFYSALLYSPIMSIFAFNGAALAWVVAWVVLTPRIARQNTVQP